MQMRHWQLVGACLRVYVCVCMKEIGMMLYDIAPMLIMFQTQAGALHFPSHFSLTMSTSSEASYRASQPASHRLAVIVPFRHGWRKHLWCTNCNIHMQEIKMLPSHDASLYVDAAVACLEGWLHSRCVEWTSASSPHLSACKIFNLGSSCPVDTAWI